MHNAYQLLGIYMSLNSRILWGAGLGILLAYLCRQYLPSSSHENVLYLAGLIASLFIGLLKMVLIPLVFSSIVVGVA
ncbi:MAG TPA: cation:dicarboxylase symporter family transporter, partial [Agitococcus sp.]|nr:cation:dicarboxylase symporter family transporter [Agitococcus sp.]HNP01926.1 cation:dicarboxylase symporter family transporter [Agitococcus sp.]